jgi:Flp pilus assembly protein TadD
MTRPTVGPASRLARGLTVAALLVLGVMGAVPAFAQSTGMVKGKVVDGSNQVVDGAKVLIEYKDGMNRKFEVKTNKKGEYLQIGLPPGNWTVTASKDGVGTATRDIKISIGATEQVDLTLAAAGAGGAGPSKEDLQFQKLFSEGVAASQAGNHDLAIEKYNEALKTRATCYSCQYNLGLSYAAKKDSAKAEEAFLAATKLKADAAEPYNQLANIYNEKKDFAKAAEMAGEAAKRSSSAGGGGGGADTYFNQGVVLMNAQKMAEAKAAFEAAVKAKPDYAEAWYLLASAYTNQGQFKEAVEAYENYVKFAPPSDTKKIEGAKQNIAALKPLIK